MNTNERATVQCLGCGQWYYVDNQYGCPCESDIINVVDVLEDHHDDETVVDMVVAPITALDNRRVTWRGVMGWLLVTAIIVVWTL